MGAGSINGRTMEAARASIDFMAENGLSPTPENFRVWSAYVSGANRSLCEAVDAHLKQGGVLDEALSAALYERFFTLKRADEAVFQAGVDARDRLACLDRTLTGAVRARRGYANALQAGGRQLAEAETTAKIAGVVGTLMAANQAIEKRSKDLERDLSRTALEMEALKTDIARLHAETLKDSLTGLANRKRFDEMLQQAVRLSGTTRRPAGLILADIDRFKAFNETWGHQTGDQVIRFMAAVFQAEAEDRYTVARYGGETFAVVIPGASLAEAGSYAEAVRRRIAQKRLIRRTTNEDLGNVTISLGVATHYPGERGESLIARALALLEESKRRGRNRATLESRN